MTDLVGTTPAEALWARLDGPAVAAALDSPLDNTGALATAAEAPAIADAVTALLESGMLRRDGVDRLGRVAPAPGLGVRVEVARAVGRTL